MSDDADGFGSGLPDGGSEPVGRPGPDAETEKGAPTPVRRMVDIIVFAPVGVALTVVEELPTLIVKGRQRVETDVRNARLIGRFVVNQGQREVLQRIGRHFRSQRAAPSSKPSTTSTPGGAPRPGAAVVRPAKPVRPTPPAPSPKPNPDPADGVMVEGALAGYDTLSASQVVRRLESLGPDQLRAVYRHEVSHRNRRTILNRAQQLLQGGGAHSATAAPQKDAARETARPVE